MDPQSAKTAKARPAAAAGSDAKRTPVGAPTGDPDTREPSSEIGSALPGSAGDPIARLVEAWAPPRKQYELGFKYSHRTVGDDMLVVTPKGVFTGRVELLLKSLAEGNPAREDVEKIVAQGGVPVAYLVGVHLVVLELESSGLARDPLAELDKLLSEAKLALGAGPAKRIDELVEAAAQRRAAERERRAKSGSEGSESERLRPRATGEKST